MKSYFIRYLYVLFVLLVSFVLFISCDESDPLIPPSEHFEPEGWIVSDATGKLILVVWQGVLQSSWNSIPVPDTLYAPLNTISDHFTVKFLDINKNIINPPTDNDYQFGCLITDTSKVRFVRDAPTDWAFHLDGNVLGSTTLELQVLHFGHVDVKTPKIPVIIRQAITVHSENPGSRLCYEKDGKLIATATEINSTGSIDIKKDSTTDHIEIEFSDNQNLFILPEYPLHSLDIFVANPAMVHIISEPSKPCVLRIKGVASGSKKVNTKLLASGVAEFISFPNKVNI